ncbi:MAG TPA: SprB repeat-containing protein, partial [Bacteroidia bacterium]
GNKDGSAGNIVQGGTPPYTFLWSNGKTTQNISGLSAGTYRMNVTDGNGCFSFVDDLVNTSNGPDAYASSVTDVSCFGLSDGNIQLSANNGTPPYKYQWSNGNTTQNISGLSEGPYSVNVVDATGCLAVASATVGKPGKLDEYISTVGSSCKKLNGTAKIVVSGGTSPYYYQWSSGESQDSIFAKSAGVYTVQVTDSHGCTTTGWATIADSISPSILVDSIVAVDCGSNGGAYITPTDPLSVKSYWWSNGWVTQNLVGVAAGGYGCIVTDTSGCKNAWFVKVPPVMPPLKPICLVTVDTSSKVNIVVWEKPTGASNISGFNIYRESTTPDVYQRIGFSPWANLSIYFDSIPNPDNRWAKYKVAMVDICGNEGALSPEHKTIHLSIPDVTAQGVHLTWDKYEGYTFSYYEIFRKANSGGTWMKIDSVPASLNNYFDLTYNPVDTNYYHVDVPAPAGGCIPSIKYPDPDATNLNTSRSNVYKVQDSTFVGVHSLADG